MDAINTSFASNDLMIQQQVPARPPPLREKSKRPQLSCNPCRARKVKCDRIQPCTACSLHQIAEICQYDLTEAERQPILQAEALKEKDKTIARLQNDLATIRGQPIKSEPRDDDPYGRSMQKMKLPPKAPRKPVPLIQKRVQSGDMGDNLYFGSPGVTSVVEEFATLAFDRKHANLTHTAPRGTDIFAFQMATSHPFPTLWSAKDDTSNLIKLLPAAQDLFFYLDSFQRRAQSCSFPHMPEECTKDEIRRFLENVETNAALCPDVLALLFATLAQGLQDGVYDKNGEKWVAGAVEAESKKGDVYIAAAMQCLRLGSFMSRPTLLVIETLVMIGPYLTNSGKFLDASALFGGTIRLAQSIGLHRNPNQLNPPASLKEVNTRKNLWWWMLHMDQHYSMMLGRPLGISSMGDCPAPEPIVPDPVIQSLSNYIAQFSVLGRQILAAGYLSNDQIDKFSDELLALQRTLPEIVQFDATWLNKEKQLPGWPLDAQAGVLHAKTHNFLLLLNRQRIDNMRRNSSEPLTTRSTAADADGVPRGRPRVLESCRALLLVFEFFQTRVRAAMTCWALGQMSFNAAMILTLSMLETGETRDLMTVQHTYSTFLEMNKLGIHKLASAAVERLGTLMKEFRAGDPANETVMGPQGMMLLEDPGLQGALPESFSPLNFEMAGGVNHPGMKRAATDLGHRTEASQLARKKAHRKPGSTRDTKLRSARKSMSKSERPMTDRRFSDGSPPHPNKRSNRSSPNLTLLTSHPGQHSFPVANPTVKHEALFSPIESNYQGFHAVNSPTHPASDLRSEFEPTSRPNGIPQAQQTQTGLYHQQHHAASDPGDATFAFSNQTTPGPSGNYFDETFQTGGHHFNDFDLHHPSLTPFEQAPYSAPPFSMPHDPSASYPQQF